MARAMVVQERQPDGSFRNGIVFQATPTKLDFRALAGDERRPAWCRAVIEQATRPNREVDGGPGTWEDWIDWAAYAFSNGYTMWCQMVEPGLTIEETFNREVLNVKPKPLTPDNLRPTDVIPESLGGYKKVKPA
jgi:hypothetical protein